MSLFAAIFCLLTHASVLVTEKVAPAAYLRICVFVAYILVTIFLLTGWAYMASVAAIYGPWAQQIRDAYGGRAETSYYVQIAASTAASSALGAVLWVLVIVNTVMFTLGSLRTEGEPMTSGGGSDPASVTISNTTTAPVYQTYAAPQQQMYAVPQQQAYAVPQQPQGYVMQQK